MCRLVGFVMVTYGLSSWRSVSMARLNSGGWVSADSRSSHDQRTNRGAKNVITRANAARLTATGTRQSATRGPVGCSMGSAVPSRLAPGDLGLAAGLDPPAVLFGMLDFQNGSVSRFRRQVLDPPGVVLDTINPRRPHRHHDVDSRPP